MASCELNLSCYRDDKKFINQKESGATFMNKRSNILIIQADQLTTLCMGVYSKPFSKTPNIDEIATKETVFNNSYYNSPVCGPPRASMIIG